MGPDGPHPQLGVSEPQRFTELIADVPPARAGALFELGQAFGADHGTPRSVQRGHNRESIDLHPNRGVTIEPSRRRHRGAVLEWRGIDRSRRCHRVIDLLAGNDRGIGEWGTGDRDHIGPSGVDRLERAAWIGTPQHEIAGRPVDRIPLQRHLGPSREGSKIARWVELGQHHRCGVVAGATYAGRPVGTGLGSAHGRQTGLVMTGRGAGGDVRVTDPDDRR